MTWEMDNPPSPSDFSDELREEAYLKWCKEYGLDPDETASAIDYEQWYEEQEY